MPTVAATTTLTAATHSVNTLGVIAAAVIILAVLVAGYLLKCWLFPFTHCHHNSGRGALRCRRCDGTSRRLRAGRHLLNRLRDLRRRR